MKTPLLYDVDTYITSGHYDNYRENMFFVASHEDDEKQFALKPMNCPGHMLLFGSALRVVPRPAAPLRGVVDAAPRRAAGTLHGLLRVRHVTQDDAHIFCTPRPDRGRRSSAASTSRASSTTSSAWSRASSSRRGRRNKLGTDEEWDFTEGALRAALERRGIDYDVNEGDGAFYGPKIDLHMTDVLGRSWQMGTIQLDALMPQRFGLTYMGPDNREHTPYVVHRALLGSLERFIGILIEHYGGAFPFWLAPVQIRVLPVGEGHLEAATAMVEKLRAAGYRVDVGEPTETIGKRIREAELQKIPFSSSTATARATKALRSGSTAGTSPRNRLRISSRSLLRLRPEKQERTRSSPPWRRPCGVQPSRKIPLERAAACSGFSVFAPDTRRSKPDLVICL